MPVSFLSVGLQTDQKEFFGAARSGGWFAEAITAHTGTDLTIPPASPPPAARRRDGFQWLLLGNEQGSLYPLGRLAAETEMLRSVKLPACFPGVPSRDRDLGAARRSTIRPARCRSFSSGRSFRSRFSRSSRACCTASDAVSSSPTWRERPRSLIVSGDRDTQEIRLPRRELASVRLRQGYFLPGVAS